MLQDPKFAANWRTIVSPKRDRSQPGPPPQLPGRVRIAMDGSDLMTRTSQIYSDHSTISSRGIYHYLSLS